MVLGFALAILVICCLHFVEIDLILCCIDLLVEFDNQMPVTLIGFVALERELGSLLGRRVDLVERETLKPAIGRRILAEVVPV